MVFFIGKRCLLGHGHKAGDLPCEMHLMRFLLVLHHLYLEVKAGVAKVDHEIMVNMPKEIGMSI